MDESNKPGSYIIIISSNTKVTLKSRLNKHSGREDYFIGVE